MSKPVLITSALPYVNNVPHLGNLIGSTLSADVYARYKRMTGHKVLYICGSDQYGTSSEIKAKQENLTCKEVCDKYHELHKKVYDWFNISFDIWGKTATDTQTKITHEIFLEIYKNGHIEEKEVEQFYCENCELVLADRYVQGECYYSDCSKNKIITDGDQCDTCGNLIDVNKFINYWCFVCKNKPKKIKSKHLFFKLGDFHKQLYDYFLIDKKCRLNANAFSLTKAWLDKGLESRCITRDLKWGTPLPDSKEFLEYKNKVFYVWFDAPIGYLSIIAHAEEKWQEWLKGDIVHYYSKDNHIFHSIIYASTLMASKKYPVATHIHSVEYLMYEGTKFSKRKNIGVFGDNVVEISELLGIDEDYWRFYLIKIRPESKDSNFSWKEFVTLIKAELCSKVGNFINRCISLSDKYFPNETFNFNLENKESIDLISELEKKIKSYCKNMDNDKLRDGLNTVLEIADLGNLYLQNKKPWDTIKTDLALAKNILSNSLYIAFVMLKLFYPFIPRKSETLLKNIIAQQEYNVFTKLEKLDIKIDKINYKIPFVQLTDLGVERALNIVGIK